jgi:hypothetical protein
VRARGEVPADRRDLLLQVYAAYNAQDVDGLLALVSDDVDRLGGAGRLHGNSESRSRRVMSGVRDRMWTHAAQFGPEGLAPAKVLFRVPI